MGFFEFGDWHLRTIVKTMERYFFTIKERKKIQSLEQLVLTKVLGLAQLGRLHGPEIVTADPEKKSFIVFATWTSRFVETVISKNEKTAASRSIDARRVEKKHSVVEVKREKGSN
jgi:hypothetical protein